LGSNQNAELIEKEDNKQEDDEKDPKTQLALGTPDQASPELIEDADLHSTKRGDD
jgi:hypothetical protein